MNMSISDSAAARIAAMGVKRGNPKLVLRVTVLGGGCSGFKYQMEFDDTTHPDDIRFEKNGAAVVTDPMSLPMLAGSEIDFVSDMMSAAFKIRNPNAASGCGCGKSFSAKET
jgi:iron-sulfur cluster insertion protein